MFAVEGEFSEYVLFYCLAEAAHEIDHEIEIMYGVEMRTQNFLGKIEMS